MLSYDSGISPENVSLRPRAKSTALDGKSDVAENAIFENLYNETHHAILL
jgi:hypothetical protein